MSWCTKGNPRSRNAERCIKLWWYLVTRTAASSQHVAVIHILLNVLLLLIQKSQREGEKRDNRVERPRQKVMSYFLTGLLISSLSTDWICTRLIAPSSHPYHPLRMNVPVHEGTILVLSDASALTLDLGSLPKCVFGKITTLRWRGGERVAERERERDRVGGWVFQSHSSRLWERSNHGRGTGWFPWRWRWNDVALLIVKEAALLDGKDQRRATRTFSNISIERQWWWWRTVSGMWD